MGKKVKGYSAVKQLPQVGWNRQNGYNFTAEFEGEYYALRGLMSRYIKEGSATEVRLDPDDDQSSGKLFVNFRKDVWGTTSGETPTEFWEIDDNNVHFSLWEHPKIKALDFKTQTSGTNANEVDRAKIRKQLEEDVEKDGDGVPVQPTWLAAGSSMDSDLQDIYRHLVKGQDVFQRAQYVLRHTHVFSSDYNYAQNTIQRAFSNVDKIITFSDLLTDATIGEPTIDAATNTSLTSIRDNTRPSGVDSGTHQQTIDGVTHQWGWLKRAPRITSEGRVKISVTQEWTLELWSTWVYTVAT